MPADTHDTRESYCPMLGHEVPFSYCRQVADSLPCRLVADCWYTQFDVIAWLTELFTPEQLSRITASPRPKIESLISLIEKARAAQKQ